MTVEVGGDHHLVGAGAGREVLQAGSDLAGVTDDVRAGVRLGGGPLAGVYGYSAASSGLGSGPGRPLAQAQHRQLHRALQRAGLSFVVGGDHRRADHHVRLREDRGRPEALPR